jgi:hypothetical protein
MRLFFMVFFSTVSFACLAEQCLTAPKDHEFINQPANNKLSRSQEHNLSRLFKALSRSWIGQVQGFYCIGEQKTSAYKKYNTYDLKISFKTESSLILKSSIEAQKNDVFTQRLSSLNIFADQGYLRFDQNNPAGDLWIESLSSNHLSVWSISRAGTIYHLINREIKRSSTAFTIKITTYSNNRLTSVYSGRLSY